MKPAPLHERIRAEIEGAILEGKLRPGDRIPKETELMAEYGCARMTVNKASPRLQGRACSTDANGPGHSSRNHAPSRWFSTYPTSAPESPRAVRITAGNWGRGPCSAATMMMPGLGVRQAKCCASPGYTMRTGSRLPTKTGSSIWQSFPRSPRLILAKRRPDHG
jgi:DNA-binding transcriptional MocR family regulator